MENTDFETLKLIKFRLEEEIETWHYHPEARDDLEKVNQELNRRLELTKTLQDKDDIKTEW